MQRCAWHLVLINQQSLAIAQEQVVEYVGASECRWVPDCSELCDHIVLWRDQVVPVLGLQHHATHCQHLLIVAYEGGLVALALARQPESIVVRDEDQTVAAEQQLEYWGTGILACIQLAGQPLPIVDFARLGMH